LNIACFLLEQGKADLFIKNKKNETPLDYVRSPKKQKSNHLDENQQITIDNEANNHLAIFLTDYFKNLSKLTITEKENRKMIYSASNKNIIRHDPMHSDLNVCKRKNVNKNFIFD
jgi:hypothetical protein